MELRDDMKTMIAEMQIFNKNAPNIVEEMKKLRKVIEKTEPTLTKGVNLMEKLDKEMTPLLKLVEEFLKEEK